MAWVVNGPIGTLRNHAIYILLKMKDINSALINLIEATDDYDAEFKALIEVFEKQEILINKDEVQLLFQLLSRLADNHHRTSDFFNKFEKIFDQRYSFTNFILYSKLYKI